MKIKIDAPVEAVEYLSALIQRDLEDNHDMFTPSARLDIQRVLNDLDEALYEDLRRHGAVAFRPAVDDWRA